MLQQIQFHVHEDEQTQQQIEQSMALQIRDNYRQSIGALERYIPSLAELAKKSDSTVSTLLCNKYSELNIVNYNSGQVLYGMHPKSEVLKHFGEYMSKAPKIEIQSSDERPSEALVCFGLGLGYHLESVVQGALFKHVVVYEPNKDFFLCSLSSLNWRRLLTIAKEKKVALYLQIGADGANFAKDFTELSTHVGVKKFLFYKHLHTPLFNSIEKKLRTSEWNELQSWFPKRNVGSLSESYLPLWAPLKNDNSLSSKFLNIARKDANLAVLKQYFPNLYEQFINYVPKHWAPCANVDGEVCLFHKETNALFSSAPEGDAEVSFKFFASKPNKDGLLLSYKGKKLKGYLHYQLVEDCESLLKDVQEVESELPRKVKSLIHLGIGSGYSLNELVQNHDIGMLFVCEPNQDFFFASLYAIDWAYIISLFDEDKKRLYLNIGDDGSNLTNDLLIQFQSVGPYVLANTFFYQSYVSERLTDAVAQLREQLLVMIAMGDYFDNAMYGIAHTRWALENDVPFLLADAKRRLSSSARDVPVFIVGNGPSLDGLIETLKTERERAIIVSCGTALFALYKNGLTPDFHAEIETNRSTFDWLSRINDPDYLKSITLLSCNGIHPDSANLFNNTLLAFKQGEASTVSLTEIHKSHPFELLNFSYPTVLNFTADLFTTVGFQEIYLLGTDLGFVSDDYHHSKSSGYYDSEGKELYNYASNHQISLVVKGNFKPWVKTKYEFKVSAKVLEQIFACKKSYIYNLSNGAYINGADALSAENILIVSTSAQKERAKEEIFNDIFSAAENSTLMSKFEAQYKPSSLIEELNALNNLLTEPLSSKLDIEELIHEQREFIVSSLLRKKSLVFYYFNGTFNYVNSIFSKLLNVMDESVVIETGNALKEVWQAFIADSIKLLEHSQFQFDAVSPHTSLRRNNVLIDNWNTQPLSVQHKNIAFEPKTKLTELALQNAQNAKPILINWVDEKSQSLDDGENTCNIVWLENDGDVKLLFRGLTLLARGDFNDPGVPYQNNPLTLFETSLVAFSSGLKNVILLQKVSFHPSLEHEYFDKFISLSKHYFCYAGPDFLVLSQNALRSEDLSLLSGDRLIYIPRVKVKDFRKESISQEEYLQRVDAVNDMLVSQLEA